MNKFQIISASFLLLAIIACTKSNPQPALEAVTPDKVITFNKHIKPLFSDRCAPCHLAGGDRNNKYDDYNTVNTLITGIIGRIKKEPTDALFMPKNGKKITVQEMALINQWIADGQLEK
jgi:hypothetical protein